MKHNIARFLGLQLSGSKSSHTSLSIMDYYVKNKKLILVDIHEKIKNDGAVSSDEVLLDIIREYNENLFSITTNAPLEFPPCTLCKRSKCPGPDSCPDKSVQWLTREYRKNSKFNTKLKPYSPYTQRPAEIYIKNEISFVANIQDSLGANNAPLTSRIHHLRKRLPGILLLESIPQLTLTRLGQSLKIPSRHLEHYRDFHKGLEHRNIILRKLVSSKLLFIYDRDREKLCLTVQSFESMILALTGFLHHSGKTLTQPKKLPEKTGWPVIPKQLRNL